MMRLTACFREQLMSCAFVSQNYLAIEAMMRIAAGIQAIELSWLAGPTTSNPHATNILEVESNGHTEAAAALMNQVWSTEEVTRPEQVPEIRETDDGPYVLSMQHWLAVEDVVVRMGEKTLEQWFWKMMRTFDVLRTQRKLTLEDIKDQNKSPAAAKAYVRGWNRVMECVVLSMHSL